MIDLTIAAWRREDDLLFALRQLREENELLKTKREWVGLTLQEIEYIEGMTLDRHDAIRMAAAALQEKNNG